MDASSPSPRPSALPRMSRLPMPNARSTAGAASPSPMASPIVTSRGSPSRGAFSASRPARPAFHQSSSTTTPTKASLAKPNMGSKIQRTTDAQCSKPPSPKDSPLEGSPPLAIDESTSREEGMDEAGDIQRSEDVAAHDLSNLENKEQSSEQGKHRASLSDRTIDTLSHMAQLPTPDRRKSSFFNPEAGPDPRSGRRRSSISTSSSGPQAETRSELRRPSQTGSREPSFATPSRSKPPSSSHANIKTSNSPKGSPLVKKGGIHGGRGPMFPPRHDGVTSSDPTKSPSPKPAEKRKIPPARSNMNPSAPASPAIAGRVLTTSSLNTPSKAATPVRTYSTPKRATPAGRKGPQTPLTDSKVSQASQKGTVPVASGDDDDSAVQKTRVAKSSSVLRETIAKAKAARKAEERNPSPERAPETPTATSATVDHFDFDFRPGSPSKDMVEEKNIGLLRKRVDAARVGGSLNICAMGLKEIPQEVLNMYDLEALDATNGAWYESVDLVRFFAADNEIEKIGSDVFPDRDPRESLENEDDKGNQFAGIELLDLRGNLLQALPTGLRWLERLSSLNLSSNSLGVECFDVISQCSNIRDLRLAHNGMQGILSKGIVALKKLEKLDVRGNTLTGLPVKFDELKNLKVLNLNENQFSSVPAYLFNTLSLSELLIADNNLEGALIPDGIDRVPCLQNLQLAHNALTTLAESSTVSFPALQQLNVSCNRITALPDVSSWVQLLDFVAEHNKISALPTGFTRLPKVKNVNLTSNDLRVLDDRIGLMESLDVFIISNNPLRQRRYLNMVTDDLKNELLSRLTPEDETTNTDGPDASTTQDASTPSLPDSTHPADPNAWPVSNGTLDRSSTQLSTLSATDLSRVGAHTAVRTLDLHHNLLPSIPLTITTFSTTLQHLNLSHNPLSATTYLTEPLSLPRLQTLNLSCTSLPSLTPLLTHLTAPLLSNLNVSTNRITHLPPLRAHFPALTHLFASENAIAQLTVDAVDGLKVVELQSNDIGHLPPRLGLVKGIQKLEVGGNSFKVPRWTVLEKGTEAVLDWLRGRVPEGEGEGEDKE
ncbi:MAG: hypothetical protein M1833_003111 [Piccolia ochrophora]|nr:MAG: hypothetical protein M1833_003111 [Piccolia ochrophora]